MIRTSPLSSNLHVSKRVADASSPIFNSLLNVFPYRLIWQSMVSGTLLRIMCDYSRAYIMKRVNFSDGEKGGARPRFSLNASSSSSFGLSITVSRQSALEMTRSRKVAILTNNPTSEGLGRRSKKTGRGPIPPSVLPSNCCRHSAGYLEGDSQH